MWFWDKDPLLPLSVRPDVQERGCTPHSGLTVSFGTRTNDERVKDFTSANGEKRLSLIGEGVNWGTTPEVLWERCFRELES